MYLEHHKLTLMALSWHHETLTALHSAKGFVARFCGKGLAASTFAIRNDVQVSAMVSRTRGTATNADSDLDLQATGRGDRANESCTEEHEERWKEHLERWPFFENVSVGNVAIKFAVRGLDGDTDSG